MIVAIVVLFFCVCVSIFFVFALVREYFVCSILIAHCSLQCKHTAIDYDYILHGAISEKCAHLAHPNGKSTPHISNVMMPFEIYKESERKKKKMKQTKPNTHTHNEHFNAIELSPINIQTRVCDQDLDIELIQLNC